MENGNEHDARPYPATVDDVAEHFGVSPRTVWRWLKRGCPHKRPGGGGPRFNLAEVNEWAEPATEEVA